MSVMFVVGVNYYLGRGNYCPFLYVLAGPPPEPLANRKLRPTFNYQNHLFRGERKSEWSKMVDNNP